MNLSGLAEEGRLQGVLRRLRLAGEQKCFAARLESHLAEQLRFNLPRSRPGGAR